MGTTGSTIGKGIVLVYLGGYPSGDSVVRRVLAVNDCRARTVIEEGNLVT